MKLKFWEKNDNVKPLKLKKEESTRLKENKVEITEKERNLFQIPNLQHYSALIKLRIVVSAIFFLCTISMIVIFVGGWVISAILLLIGYVLLFILLIKLFMTKRL
jgi:hypothetical protein